MEVESRRILITGASSGIGRACCELLINDGHRVTTLDIKDAPPNVTEHIKCDMADPSAIDDALDKIEGSFDSLLNIAGAPGTVDPDLVMKVNIIGLKHLTDSVVGRLNPGGTVVSIASIAGLNWRRRLQQHLEFLALPNAEASLDWFKSHPMDSNEAYHFSKEAVIVYMMKLVGDTRAKGLRCNSVSPGPVDSPLLPAFVEQAGSGQMDWVMEQTGGATTPAEIAQVVGFLAVGDHCINGENVTVDRGFTAGLTTGWIDKRESPIYRNRDTKRAM